MNAYDVLKEHHVVIKGLGRKITEAPVNSEEYEDEWNSFKTVLEAHADEDERDMIPAPPPVQITDDELEELGNTMAVKMEQYRGSALHKLRTKGRAALVRAL